MMKATSTSQNNQNQIPEMLDFESFIKSYFPQYEIDGHVHSIIKSLSLYAARNAKFNSEEKGWHIDKGLIFVGSYGVGKDELVRLLSAYYRYLNSPYGFRHRVVWEYTPTFLKKNYDAFTDDYTGNVYYEELALVEEGDNGVPVRELANSFGNKVLIGRELIAIRYKVWKGKGFISHWSTNMKPTDLEICYGGRAWSRLQEMANFIFVPGVDRRPRIKPAFYSNSNAPTMPGDLVVPVNTIQENMANINEKYAAYCDTGAFDELMAIWDYDCMWNYGIVLFPEDEIQKMIFEVKAERKQELAIVSSDHKVEYHRRQLRLEYEKGKLSREEKHHIWNVVRKRAVLLYFKRLKDEGKKFVFEKLTENAIGKESL